MRTPPPEAGDVFGRLTVVSFFREKDSRGYCICSCNCGKIKTIYANSLKSGATQSCGCLQKERASNSSNLIHGNARAGGKTPEFLTWQEMHRRCYDPTRGNWKNYGGRGITVCRRWHAFKNFLSDMGKRPEGMSIGRIDNNGNYTPKNCEWQTLIQQANNRSNNHFVQHGGRTMTLAEWAQISSIPYSVLISRIKKLGWSFGRAISTPPRPHK